VVEVRRVLEALDGWSTRRWALSTLSALGRARAEIDALNVFPVPDGDTGTNLYLTVESACAAVLALPSEADVRQVAEAFAHGALLGARGNAGIIGAQLLRGWADVLAEHGVLDARAAKEAFRRGDAQAWQAVDRPVEGTILSVSRASAQAASAAGDELPAVATAAVRAARQALARTPEQLEVLRRSGVVDAGGRGLVVILETLEDVVHQRSSTRAARSMRAPVRPVATLDDCADLVAGNPSYEVMYLLDADETAVATLRTRLAALGDSLVVVGGSGLWHVHVHVNDPGAAVEAGIEAGRPYRVRITHFGDQRARRRAVAGHAAGYAAAGYAAAGYAAAGNAGPAAGRCAAGVAVVACAAGPGLADLFRQAGAVVVRGAADRRPSTDQLLDAVRATGAGEVVVLPNDDDTQAVAEAAARTARESGVRVSVVPTRAQVQGLAAIAVHEPGLDFEEDLVRMSAAAGSCRDGAVTVAVREAITTAGPCREGDVLGVVQGDFAVVGTGLIDVARQVLDRLLSGGGELVTLVRGAEADDTLVRAVREHLRRRYREVEVSMIDGGQERYVLLLGVE
jgi:DAK2 domain fusion protein YloV